MAGQYALVVYTCIAVLIQVNSHTLVPDALRQSMASNPAFLTTRNVTTTIVHLQHGGALRGLATSSYRLFLGIRYAKPPTGGRRWASPEPIPPWRGTVDTLSYGAACYQDGGFNPSVGCRSHCSSCISCTDRGVHRRPVSEDCLFLNVVTPSKEKGGDLPVVVWIHGGAPLDYSLHLLNARYQHYRDRSPPAPTNTHLPPSQPHL